VGLLLIGSSHAHWTRSALLRCNFSDFFRSLLVLGGWKAVRSCALIHQLLARRPHVYESEYPSVDDRPVFRLAQSVPPQEHHRILFQRLDERAKSSEVVSQDQM
jgi:hypothetical protein